MRAICPATVSMLINLISKWHCDAELRKTSLKCYALMAIVLQRSSPVEVCPTIRLQQAIFILPRIILYRPIFNIEVLDVLLKS